MTQGELFTTYRIQFPFKRNFFRPPRIERNFYFPLNGHHDEYTAYLFFNKVCPRSQIFPIISMNNSVLIILPCNLEAWKRIVEIPPLIIYYIYSRIYGMYFPLCYSILSPFRCDGSHMTFWEKLRERGSRGEGRQRENYEDTAYTKAKGNMFDVYYRARSVCAAINGHARTPADMASQWFLKPLGERRSRGPRSSISITLFLITSD